MKTLHQHVKLNKTTGKELIADADKLFTGYIDSDFKNWKIANGEKTKPAEVAVVEMDTDFTFVQVFTDPEHQYLTQGQVIDFVKNHKEKLHPDGWYTFFLLKSGKDFFVAGVGVGGRGRLSVSVRSLEDVYVWRAGYQLRIVVPQLALKNLGSPNSSDPSDTLTLPNELIINGVKYVKSND